MEILQIPTFGTTSTFAGHPTWRVDGNALVADFSDGENQLSLRIDPSDLRRLAATPGGLTISRAIERLVQRA